MESIYNSNQQILSKLDRIIELLTPTEKNKPENKKKRTSEKLDKKCDLLLGIWNMFAKKNKMHGLSTVRSITPKRKSAISQRCKEDGFDFDLLLKIVSMSPFLLGKNKKKWRVDFDFIICSPNNWVKILEGKYIEEQDKRAFYEMITRYDETRSNEDCISHEDHNFDNKVVNNNELYDNISTMVSSLTAKYENN